MCERFASLALALSLSRSARSTTSGVSVRPKMAVSTQKLRRMRPNFEVLDIPVRRTAGYVCWSTHVCGIVYVSRREVKPEAMNAPSFFRERKYRSVLVIGLDNAGMHANSPLLL